MPVDSFEGIDHDARERYLREHAEQVYAALTEDYATPLRLDELVYQLVVERPGALDELTVHCEPVTDGIDGPGLRARIARTLRERTGISIAVELLAPGAVPRSEGKAVRVVDRRPH